MVTTLNNLKYHELSVTGDVLVIMLDNLGRIIFFNKACELATGYNFKDVINHNFWDFIVSSDEADILRQGLQDFHAERFPHKFTTHLSTKNGETKLISWTDNILLNRDEKADRIVFYGRDITDSGEANQEKVDRALPQLFTNSGLSRHCFWITNSNGKILDASDTYCALTGYTRSELLKLTMSDVDANLKPDDVKARIQKVIREGSRYFNSNHKCRDGSYIELQVLANHTEAFGGLIFFTSSPQQDTRDAGPQVTRFSEQKNIIKAKMFDSSNDAIFIHDFNGNFTFVNKTAWVKLGFSKEEMMDMNLADFMTPQNSEYMEQHMKKLIENGSVCYQTTYMCKNRVPLKADVKSQVMDIGNKKLILTVAQDVTEIEELKRERKADIEKMQQLLNAAEITPASADQSTGDITEQKRLEAELNRQNELLGAIALNSGIGFSIVSREHKVVWANNVIKQTFGNIEDQLCYAAFKRCEQLCPACEARQIFQSGQDHVTCQQTLTDKDGKTIDYKIIYSAIKNEKGEPIQFYQVLIPVPETIIADGGNTETNDRLVKRLSVFNQSRNEIALMSKMGGFLQICINMQETHRVIAQFLPLLLPSVDGALYLLNSSTDMYGWTTGWGNSVESDEVFSPDACWSIRRRKVHHYKCDNAEELCHHCTKGMKRSYLDIPLIYQGKILGLLHLEDKNENGRDNNDTLLNGLTKNLATIVAGQLAFALSNIGLQEVIREQAIRDTLTGLYNRRYMEQALDKQLRHATRTNSSVGVITLDLDSFGKFNERYGYKSGDLIMRNLGDFLKSNSHPDDIVCRGNGDEFAIICPQICPDRLKQRAEEILEGLKYFNKRHQDLYQEPLTLSLGTAIFPNDGHTSEQIIKSAETALKQAEREGGD